MTRQIVNINNIERKISKAGNDYWVMQTTAGRLTCHEKAVMDMIKPAFDNHLKVELDIVESGDYLNVRQFFGSHPNDGQFQNIAADTDRLIDQVETIKVNEPGSNFKQASNAITAVQARKSVKGSAYEKDPVGLAVEVFNSLDTKDYEIEAYRMETAIELVKKAQQAFS